MGNILKDKVAVISGSGQGIGKAIAMALAKEGAKVVTNNRWPGTPAGDAETTASEIVNMGGKAVAFFGDVSRFRVARDFIKTAVDNFGRLDILINNAGIIARDWVWNITEKAWDRCVDSSLKSSFNCIRHSSNIMREQRWGRIINTTSLNWTGTQGGSDYCAAKAGIIALTKCVALEMSSYSVTCNAYAPVAATRMSLSDEALSWNKMRHKTGVHDEDTTKIFLNPPRPEVVTPLLVYLCTDEAASVNGQVFVIRESHITTYSMPEEINPIDKKKGLWTVEELRELIPKMVLKGD